MSFYKTIAIAIFEQQLYHDIYFPCQALLILGSFDKIVPMKNEFWILSVETGFLMLPMKIELFDIASGNWAFDIVNENWAFDITSKNWALILPMRIEL